MKIVAIHPQLLFNGFEFPSIERATRELCVIYTFPTNEVLTTYIEEAIRQRKTVIVDTSEWTTNALRRLGYDFYLIYPTFNIDDASLMSLRRRFGCQHIEVGSKEEYDSLVWLYEPVRGIDVHKP